MEMLRRCSGIDYLQIVFGSQMKESLQARAGMFRPLTFKTMWQQQDQAAEPLPFILRAGNELIHDWLSCVPEVTVLGLPQDEAVRIIQAVAILKPEHACFRKRSVENLNRRWFGS